MFLLPDDPRGSACGIGFVAKRRESQTDRLATWHQVKLLVPLHLRLSPVQVSAVYLDKTKIKDPSVRI